MPNYIPERIYFPTGCDPDNFEAFSFSVGVFYRGPSVPGGPGHWMVAISREGNLQLSQTGKWLFVPAKMNALQWCRFDFETACRLAEEHVDTHTVNGRTWSEWEARELVR